MRILLNSCFCAIRCEYLGNSPVVVVDRIVQSSPAITVLNVGVRPVLQQCDHHLAVVVFDGSKQSCVIIVPSLAVDVGSKIYQNLKRVDNNDGREESAAT